MLRCRITRARTAIRSCRRTTISASAHFSTARRQKSFGYPLEMQVPIRSRLSYGPGANGCARLISSPARACLFLKHRRQHDVRNASPPTILRRRPFAVSRARGGGRLEAGLRLLSITEMVDKPFSLDVSFPRSRGNMDGANGGSRRDSLAERPFAGAVTECPVKINSPSVSRLLIARPLPYVPGHVRDGGRAMSGICVKPGSSGSDCADGFGVHHVAVRTLGPQGSRCVGGTLPKARRQPTGSKC
jgi:hypothetical protein